MSWVAGAASAVVGALLKIGLFAWAVFSGKRKERLDQSEAALEAARKSNDIDESIHRLSDDDRARWLYGSDGKQ